jgi:signal transduction histidine kinase
MSQTAPQPPLAPAWPVGDAPAAPLPPVAPAAPLPPVAPAAPLPPVAPAAPLPPVALLPPCPEPVPATPEPPAVPEMPAEPPPSGSSPVPMPPRSPQPAMERNETLAKTDSTSQWDERTDESDMLDSLGGKREEAVAVECIEHARAGRVAAVRGGATGLEIAARATRRPSKIRGAPDPPRRKVDGGRRQGRSGTMGPLRSPRQRLLAKLLVGTLLPTIAALSVYGLYAHEVARRALEDELGRRLATAAAGAAATILPEQLRAYGAGDEASLTYANVRRKLDAARARLGVRRVVAVAADLTARGDTTGALALGASAYELGADKAEIERARSGIPSASPLFVGHDGRPYKRAYAAVGDAGDAAALIAVEGDADYYVALAAFRHRLLFAGALALLAVLGVTALIARRISGPVVRLADAAARLGRGELDARIPVETRDEIGFLASTLDETRAALQARDERLQMMLAGIAHEVRNPLGGLELYAGLLRDALDGQPERLAEVARIERELGHLRTVVSEFLEYARRPRLELGPVPLRPLLDEVRELTEPPAGVRVVVDAPS